MAALVAPEIAPVFVGYVLSTLTMLFLAVYTIREQETDRTLLAFAALLVTIALWSWADAGRLLADSVQGKLLFHYVGYVGVVSAPVAWLHFVFLYTGRADLVSWRTVTGLSIVPVGAFVLAVTNYNGVFYRPIETVTVGTEQLITLPAGPAFWAWTSYAYLLVLVGVVLLVAFALSTDTLYQLQSTLLVAAAVAPVSLNALFLSGTTFVPSVDPTPITFALSGLLIAVAVFYGQFVQLLPIARDTIVETLDDGILVVDESGQILQVNPAARALFADGHDGQLLGASVSTVLPWDIDPGTSSVAGREVSRETDDGREWFWFRQIDLDGRQTATGRIYMFTAITDRKELEQRLRALQETHQELMTVETVAEIGDVVVGAARDVLDLPITGLWRFDEESEELVPVATTSEADALVGSPPTFTAENSLAWTTFQQGTLRVFDEVTDREDTYNSESAIASEIQVPVGDYGLITTGSSEPTEFEDVSLELVRILAAATERAFVRTEREMELRRRKRQLTRKNEQLEEFTSVVAHDLRSPLNSADIFLDRLTSDYDDDRLEAVATAHDRTKELVDDLLALARQGKAVEDRQSVAVNTVARRAWDSTPTGECTFEITDDCGTVRADESRLRQVFENLFGNAVEHAGKESTVRVGSLPNGFYVADDGPGIPEAEQSHVFDHGYTQSEDGTGFGLAIVRRIVEAHGWDVRATHAETGGLRIEIYGVDAGDQATPDTEPAE